MQDMPQVPLIVLNNGRTCPILGLGTWKQLGNVMLRQSAPGDVMRAVKDAIDVGYRHIDCAFVYGNEKEVGEALKTKFQEGVVKREDMFVTSKLWNTYHRPDLVEGALKTSLANLGLEYLDLYLIHWPCGQFANQSYDLTDHLDTWRGMIQAKQLGLTRSIGLSNFNQHQIQRILDAGLDKPQVLQVELNLSLQQPSLLAYCAAQDIAVTAYTPFGSLFPGKARADAPPPRADDPALVQIAQKYNKTVPQIALRYLVELGVAPLPKSLTKSRIEQNVDIFDFQLTPEEKQLLKSFDRGYRTLPQLKWLDHPYFPFEKN